jgi:hypothetical protein
MTDSSKQKKIPADESTTGVEITIIYLIAFALLATGWFSTTSAIKSFHSKDWPVYLGQVVEGGYVMKDSVGNNGGSYKEYLLEYSYFFYPEESHSDNLVMGFDSWYMVEECLPNLGAMVEVHYDHLSGSTCLNTSVNWSNIALSLVSFYFASLLLFGRLMPAKLKLILGLFAFGSIPFWLIASGFGWLADKSAPYKPNILEICEQHAEDGLAEYQCRLGDILQEGTLVSKDSHRALEWYKKAADQGHSMAPMKAAQLLIDSKDTYRALEWYKKAADQGHPMALMKAAQLLIDGNMTDPIVTSLIINAYNKEASDPINKFFIGGKQKELHDISVKLLIKEKEYKKALKLHIECYNSKKDERTGNPILSSVSIDILEYWLLLGDIHNGLGNSEAALAGWEKALAVGSKISADREISIIKGKILLLESDGNSTQSPKSK